MAGPFGTFSDVLAGELLQHVQAIIVVIHNSSIASKGGWLTTLLPKHIPRAKVVRFQYEVSQIDSFSVFQRLGDLFSHYLHHISRASGEVGDTLNLSTMGCNSDHTHGKISLTPPMCDLCSLELRCTILP